MKQAGKRSSSPTAETVLFDRRHEYCYVLGPVVLTGVDIDSASVAYDSGVSQWAVVVHWSNDDFVKKVAQPLVNKQAAIIINGAVHSAPKINPGITGRDVEIISGYSRADAVTIVASMLGIAPSRVRILSNP